MINEDEDQHKYKVSIIKIRKSFVVLVIILHASTYYKPRRTILGVNSCVQLLKGTVLNPHQQGKRSLRIEASPQNPHKPLRHVQLPARRTDYNSLHRHLHTR